MVIDSSSFTKSAPAISEVAEEFRLIRAFSIDQACSRLNRNSRMRKATHELKLK